MKALHWLSDTLRRLNPRERRMVLGGALVSASALVIVLLGLPFARRWAVREAAYTASREQWLRFAALTGNTDGLRRALVERKLAHAPDEARLVTGATPALAASSLQGLLQRYADESSVQLNRVDVASQPRPGQSSLLAIPVQLQCPVSGRHLWPCGFSLPAGAQREAARARRVVGERWVRDEQPFGLWSSPPQGAPGLLLVAPPTRALPRRRRS